LIKWPLDFPRELKGEESPKKRGLSPVQLLGDYKDFVKKVSEHAEELLNVPADFLGKGHLLNVLSIYNSADTDSLGYPKLFRQIVAAFGTIVCNETNGVWEVRGLLLKKLVISTGRGFGVTRYEVIELLDEFAQNEESRIAFLK